MGAIGGQAAALDFPSRTQLLVIEQSQVTQQPRVVLAQLGDGLGKRGLEIAIEATHPRRHAERRQKHGGGRER